MATVTRIHTIPSSNGNSNIRLKYVCNQQAATTTTSTSDTDGADGVKVVLIHGLDSSSHTWKRTLDSLDKVGIPALAIDCRGCGRSDLGDPNDFGPKTLVDDLHQLLHACHATNHKNQNNKVVLVGHSMGGRIAMSYAAHYPQELAALIVEDMDIDRRPNNPFPRSNTDAVLQFDRNLNHTNCNERVVELFSQWAGYPSSMVEGWIQDGRIYATATGGFWSDVNPAFRHLCYQHFCYTDQGEQAWNQIATSSSSSSSKRTTPIPCHVMVASKDHTICRPQSIHKMQQIMNDNNNNNHHNTINLMTVHHYPDATHSIHNSAHSQFISDLIQIIHQTKPNQTYKA